MESVWLFNEHSPHKQMLFAVPQEHVQINIFLIYTCLIRHSHTDVDIAVQKHEAHLTLTLSAVVLPLSFIRISTLAQ